jgi:uncharacterized cupin superfamily protein
VTNTRPPAPSSTVTAVPAASSTILTGDARRRDLQPMPIFAPHVIAGEPEARSVKLTESADGLVSTHVWDCTAGRFHWNFGVDEIVHILDGEVHVTDDDGQTIVLGVGDVGHFALNSHTVWDVPEYVRKLAFHRAPKPVPLPIRALRKLGRAIRALRRAPG